MTGYEGFTLVEADTILRHLKKFAEENRSITVEQLYSIDLDALSSSVFGGLDILGQVQKWFSERLSEVSSWVVSGVSGFIERYVKPLLNDILGAASSISSRVNDALSILRDIPGRLASGFEEVKGRFSGVLSEVGRIGGQISGTVESFRSAALGSLQTILSIVQNLPNQIGNVFSNLESFRSSAVGFLNNIFSLLQNVSSSLGSLLGNLEAFRASALSTLGSLGGMAQNTLTLLSNIGGIANNIFATVQTKFGEVGASLGNLWGGIAGQFGNVLNLLGQVWGYINTFANTVTSKFSELLQLLANVGGNLQNLAAQLTGGLNIIFQRLTEIPARLGEVGSFLQQMFSDIGQRFSGVGKVLENTWDGIVKGFNGVQALLTEKFGTVVESLRGLIKDLEDLSKYVNSLGAQVLGGLPSLNLRIGDIVDSINKVGDAVSKIGGIFGEIASSPGAAIKKYIADPLWKNLVEPVLDFVDTHLAKPVNDFFKQIEPMSKALENFGNVFGELVSDPGGALKKYLLDPVWGALDKHVLQPLWSSLTGLGQWLQDGLKWLVESLQGSISYLAGAVGSVVDAIRSAIESAIAVVIQIANSIGGALRSSVEGLVKGFVYASKVTSDSMSAGMAEVKPLVDQLFEQTGIRSPPYLSPTNVLTAVGSSILYSSGLFASTAIMQLPARTTSFLMRAFGMYVSNALKEVKISLKFLGLGGDATFSLGRAIGGIFYTMGSELARIYEKWLDYSAMGLLFWYGQATSRLLTFTLRNYLPLEIPPIAVTLEFARRASVAEKYPESVARNFKDVMDGLRYYMGVRGFADFVVEMMFADENSYAMKIRDRFSVERLIPLSTRYVLPSPTMLASMIIRDIVVPPNADWSEVMGSIQKLLGAVGMHPNIAKLFYVYHYKYPPVEALARFYWRGIAGSLWARDSFEETSIKKALGIPESWVASRPVDLNYKADVLNNMMSLYLRWHDFFPTSWAPNLPTDKSIMYELTADLPTRIDLRWITRWGLFEHLSKLGAKLDTPAAKIKELMKSASGRETASNKVSPDISLDVSGLARLLEATGYHPDYVPLLAVAQAHQIITEELTLTRTGFIESYRRGFIDLDTSEALMSGMFVVNFTTGWIDPQTGKPETFDYKKPVLWLPAERRLLQLRSIFDRYNMLLRDALTRMTRSVQYLALTRVEALDAFTKLFESVAAQWSKEVKAVTGVEWKPVLDKAYIELYTQYADMFRTIGMREWTRRYTARIMSWLMYRVSYGWLRKEDYEDLLRKMTDRGYLTDFEREYFETIFSWVAGLVTREHTPSPSTLASLAEYMVIPPDIVERSFKALRVPDDVAELYRKYISFRPLKSDYRQILTVGRRAYVKGIISKDEWEKILSDAALYGFTDAELQLISKLVALEVARETYEGNETVRYPTPLTLASMAEYCVVPDDLVKLAIERYKVAAEYQQLYIDYIRAKPLKSEYRSLISAARKAFLRGLISESDYSTILSESTKYGFTPAEVSIISAATALSELLAKEEEYVPTISQLLTLVEYINLPIELVRTVLAKRNVRAPWDEFWTTAIYAMSLSDEVRTLLSSYLRAKRAGVALPEEVERAVSDYLKKVGISSEEMNIRSLAMQIETLIESIPSLGSLATIADYVDVPLDYVSKVLALRRVEKTFAELWLRYLQARQISTEVARVVAAFTQLVTRYDVPSSLVEQVKSLMSLGGWTSDESAIWNLELQLRRMYRELSLLLPSVRAFTTDALYLSDTDSLLRNLLAAYGLDANKYAAQIEYYKKLIKNRRLWRHFSTLRSNLIYAYGYGAITLEQVKRTLQKYKDIGLIDDDEIAMILEACELYRLRRMASA